MQPDTPSASSDTSGAQSDPDRQGQSATDPSMSPQPAPGPDSKSATASSQTVLGPPPPVTPDPNGAAASTMDPAAPSATFPAQSGQPFTIPVSPDPRAIAPDDAANPPATQTVGPSASLQRIQAFDLGEITMAKLAAQSGGRAVATYAKRVLRDRRAAEAQVKRLAAKLDVQIDQSDEMAQDEQKADQDQLARLEPLTGAEFDRAYARHMIDDRQEAVDTLTDLRSNTSEPKIATLIGKLLPLVQREEQEARALPVGSASATNP